MSKVQTAQVNVKRVYITQTPFSINSPSIPKSINISFERESKIPAKEKFGGLSKKVVRPVQNRRAKKK